MYLVFDVGGSSTKYAWMTGEGEIIERGKFKTPLEEGTTQDDYVNLLAGVYEEYKEKCADNMQNIQIEGIAISLPGQIDVDNGIVYGGGALRYMHKAPLQEMLSNRCDGVKVALENDGKCAALAEVWKGNASDVNDACVMIIGTGIGGALIKDRHVHRGKHMLAGEISYLFDGVERKDLDNLGCMENFDVSGIFDNFPFSSSTKGTSAAMCHRVALKKNLNDEDLNAEKVYQWAKEGDAIAKEELEELYFHLAAICMNLYVTFDPEVILFGGGISAEPKFIEGVRKYMEKLKYMSQVFSECQINVCKYMNDSNLLGALFNFMQKYDID